MPKAIIADTSTPMYKALIAQHAYYPGKLPRPWPHGHWLHKCGEYCFGRKDVPLAIADLPIRIERVGGGASPLGFAAMKWPDELHAHPLTALDYDGPFPVEDYTEDGCYHLALVELIYNGFIDPVALS